MLQENLKRYKELKYLLEKYRYANFIISYDAVTICPLKDREHSSEVQDFFSKLYFDITLGDEYISLIDKLYENKDELDEVTKLDIEIEHKNLEKMRKIPRDELNKHLENESRCYLAWERAHESLDYTDFFKEFEELVEYNKKYINYLSTDTLKGFDVLIDDMEEGYTSKEYDEFFKAIEDRLLPFVKKVLSAPRPYNKKLDTLKFDVTKQKEITELIAKQMGYTKEVGCITETLHPFTNWANNNDVRITTSYSEELLFSNIYSVMHEIGHALYQLQMDDKYNGTNVFNNVTCIAHESQSRFYENFLGRRRSFVEYLYPILKEFYPEELSDITCDDLYNYINSVQAQFKRTEADELTYPFHVTIRYNVEKELFVNNLDPKKVPEVFDKYMEKYLGIRPSNLKEGAFQDVHWTSGFGYFPTYAVASACGAMFFKELEKDIDVDNDLRKGDFTNINKWLKEHIHQYSGSKNITDLLHDVCHKDFDVNVFIDYLIDKFSKIYNLN